MHEFFESIKAFIEPLHVVFHLVKRGGFFDTLAMTPKVGRTLRQETVQPLLVVTQGGCNLGALKHAVWNAGKKVHGGGALHGTGGPVYKSM